MRIRHVMPQQGGYEIAIKDSAIRENQAVERLYDQEGAVLEYESRAAATEAAEDLSVSGNGRVAFQQAAPNDPSSVDAYLVHAPVQHKHTPEGTLENGWTFDTTANQYGALGETTGLEPPITPAWRFETGDWVLSSPAVVDDTVYVGSRDERIYALEAGAGDEQWRFEADDWIGSSPAIDDGVLYVGSDGGNVYALTEA